MSLQLREVPMITQIVKHDNCGTSFNFNFCPGNLYLIVTCQGQHFHSHALLVHGKTVGFFFTL